ncbi:hypothetical protein T492DRAFT_1131883 [Pavlovales sp. CCMP2436]|nr:hypothetical protein T492DRAFT_1131883 [Pavlovales sp. CCMP2436]
MGMELGGISFELLEHVFSFLDPVDIVHTISVLDPDDTRTIALKASPSLDSILPMGCRCEPKEQDVLGLRPPVDNDANEPSNFWSFREKSDPPRRDQAEIITRKRLCSALRQLGYCEVAVKPGPLPKAKQPFTRAEIKQVAAGLYAHGGGRRERCEMHNIEHGHVTSGVYVYLLPKLDGYGCQLVDIYNLAPLTRGSARCSPLLQIARSIGSGGNFEWSGQGVNTADDATWMCTCAALGIDFESSRLGQVMRLLVIAATDAFLGGATQVGESSFYNISIRIQEYKKK